MTRRQRWSRRGRLLTIGLSGILAGALANAAMGAPLFGTQQLASGAVVLLALAAGERLLLQPDERSLELVRQTR